MLADLEKTAVILESHLGNSLGLRLLDKGETFQFFSYLFDLSRNGRSRISFAAIPAWIGRLSEFPLPGIATTCRLANATYRCSL